MRQLCYVLVTAALAPLLFLSACSGNDPSATPTVTTASQTERGMEYVATEELDGDDADANAGAFAAAVKPDEA